MPDFSAKAYICRAGIYEYDYFETLSCEDKTLFWYIYAIYTCKSYPKRSKNIRNRFLTKFYIEVMLQFFPSFFFEFSKLIFGTKKIELEKNLDINIDVKNCQESIYDVFRTFRALLP